MKISVVVPVYNTSRFLRQCVDSLINQTLKDVEFIFVDDGSTDDSLEILKQYQEKDERVKILHQENLHAGVARNNGMKQATGKYILFLDSDDYFDLKLLEEAFCCAEKKQAEVVFWGHYIYDNQTGEIRKRLFRMRHGVFSGEMLGDNVFSTFSVVPWNRLYLRSFIMKYNLEYQKIYKHNDVYFGLASVALAERIACLNKRLVYHRINNPESLQGNRTYAFQNLIEVYSGLKEKLIAHGKFYGSTRNAYNKLVIQSIKQKSRLKPEVIVSKQYFSEMKKNLVPGIFESPEDFTDDTVIPRIIYESTDYDHYVMLLVERLNDQSIEMISKKSKDYIVGHALLAIPRKIKCALRGI